MTSPVLRLAAALVLGLTMLAAGLAPARADSGVRAFESRLAAAYAHYRAALFQTNKTDQTASKKALTAFDTGWTDLIKAQAGVPPPHYADDPKWRDTVAAISRISAAAHAEIDKGDLAKAHEVLEEIRDVLSDLRARNGIVIFSDRMNDYHARMEKILTGRYGGFDAAGLGQVREDAAVLSYLLERVKQQPAPGTGSDPAYAEMVKAVAASVDGLMAAARSGDAAAVKAAIGKLKPPYAKLFLKHG